MFSPLLPTEPGIQYPAAQAELTARHLLPALPQLQACLLAVRRQLDPELERLQPVKLGKPYPLGQCLEISLAVQKRLSSVRPGSLPPDAAAGLRALRAFQRAGGDFRQVWGDLRGQYFQNAFQLGTLYVDVANDTVTPTKPQVEILPFDQAQFVPIRDFHHFGQLARAYWGDRVYPNHVLPALAPHCPLIHINQTGRIMLHDATQYMLAMTRHQGFVPSEAALRQDPMPPALFERVRQALHGAGHALAATPAQGRQQALQQCRQQRARRWHLDRSRRAQVMQDVQRVNLQLAHWCQQHPVQEQNMPTITIDHIEYDLDTLPEEAKAQLQSIQFVDQELARLQARVAAMQTARNAYVSALRAALPRTTP